MTMEINGVAAVPDDMAPVTRFLKEAYCHAVEQRCTGVLPGMHLPRSFRAQYLGITVTPILQLGNHEVRDVVTGN